WATSRLQANEPVPFGHAALETLGNVWTRSRVPGARMEEPQTHPIAPRLLDYMVAAGSLNLRLLTRTPIWPVPFFREISRAPRFLCAQLSQASTTNPSNTL